MSAGRLVRGLVVLIMTFLSIPLVVNGAVILGDINFDNKIGVEEAISSLMAASGETDPNILNVTSMQSGYGTYTFDENTNEIEIILTHSNIPESKGPEVGDSWGGLVTFPDSDTMSFDGITFTRKKSGTGSAVTGVWEVVFPDELYRLFISSSDDYILLIRYTNIYEEDPDLALNKKTININVDVSDWSIEDRVYLDEDGPECENAPGQDLQEVYMAQDDEYLYLRYKLNGSPDTDFGYKFGANLHTFVWIDGGTGEADIMWATPVGMSMALPDENADTSGNEIEFRVDLCQPGWDRVRLDAWLDDYNYVTGERTCIDHVELPDYEIDMSGCP